MKDKTGTGRKCRTCGKFRLWIEFSKQKAGMNGRTCYCKKCRRESGRIRYANSEHKPRSAAEKKVIRDAARVRRWGIRIEVIGEYGGKCLCCGEDSIEFLVIDHVNGGGDRHRLSLGCKTGGTLFYAKLKKMGYPFRDELRVLCANCNSSLGYFGYCPHRKKDPATKGYRRL